MIKKYFLILFLYTSGLFAQGEANNWFFGAGAGIHFDANGVVTSLTNGQIQTNEGCSSISNANGDLLFYTDGRTVWDRNHVIMPNGDYFGGKGLFGDPSSTQSGIIVPKPNDPNTYYIFTVDEPHHDNAATYPARNTGFTESQDDGYNNGFNYSTVNLQLTGSNGSIGNITNRNKHLITYDTNPNGDEIKYKCSEKITAVKDASGGYWVITHFINRFYAFRVTSTGVSQTPVVSIVDPYITLSGYRRNAIGYLKASPNGQKLAIAHSQNGTQTGETTNDGSVYLYDFDKNTGIVSNPVALINSVNAYGIEFSAETKKLYASIRESNVNSIAQFDLESANIPGSILNISNTTATGALQLGPDKKIYFTNSATIHLSVINNPEETGSLAGFVMNAITLSSGLATLGLPPFITSVFYPSFQVANTCFGDTTTFTMPASLTNQAYTSIEWNFGDASPVSNAVAPTHVYAAPGDYPVSVTVVINGNAVTNSETITIYEVPVANPVGNLQLCDSDSDGLTQINLQQQTGSILGTQSPTVFEVLYFLSPADAASNQNAIDPTNFTNTVPSFTLYARVQNRSNSACFAVTSFQVTVTPKPVVTVLTDYALCDDSSSNGYETFDLQTKIAGILGTQNAVDHAISFHATQADADAGSNALPYLFTNTNANSQEIYVRIENTTNTNCYSTKSFFLKVNTPPVVSPATLVQCDFGLNPDGFTTFNLNEADAVLTNGNANRITTFFLNNADAVANTAPLNPVYTNISNPQQISVRVTDTQTGCYSITTLSLHVNTTATQELVMNGCSDNGYYTFSLTGLGLETSTNTVKYYSSVTDALLEQNELNTAFTNTTVGFQTVYARVESNNDCEGLHEIKLYIRRLPALAVDASPKLCTDQPVTPLLLTSGIASANGYQFLWSTGATTPTISVITPGVYTVAVTNVYGCSAIRTLTVEPSNVATVTAIEVEDLTENNTITVYVTGSSNHYVYGMDAPDGPFQDSNFFENVATGIHTVYIRDFNGCGTIAKQVAVLGIPKYFTPNGDGYNDLWRIKGAANSLYKNSIVNIFDRYGKLLRQMKASEGWNGIYNNQPLPATDYWYVVYLQDGREVKGHFTLKR